MILKYKNFLYESKLNKINDSINEDSINEEISLKELAVGFGILLGGMTGNVKSQEIPMDTLNKMELVVQDDSKIDKVVRSLKGFGMGDEAKILKNKKDEVKSEINKKTFGWTNNEKSIEIFKIFSTKYIPSVIDNYINLDVNGLINSLKDLDVELSKMDKESWDSDSRNSIKFFKKHGYSPDNEYVKTLQKDIMSATKISEYTTPEGNKKFDDGTFGLATTRALINFMINKFEKQTDKSILVSDLFNVGSEKSQLAPSVKLSDIDINIDKQKK
jgi:hypothetical protein